MNVVVGVITVAGHQGGEGAVGKQLKITGAKSVGVAVFIKFGTTFVYAAGAVVVEAVATDLLLAGIAVGIGVIAIRVIQNMARRLNDGYNGNFRIAVFVTVIVLIPGQAAFIHSAGAVVVQPVAAGFGQTGVDAGVVVITIPGPDDITGRLGGGFFGSGGIPVGVAVGVHIPGKTVLVDVAIAVVVHGIRAYLHRARMDGGIGIVTVAAFGDVAGRRLGIIIDDIGVAIAVDVGVPIPACGGKTAFIHVCIAVIVKAVTQFDRAGVNGGVGIVTVLVVADVPGRLVRSGINLREVAKTIAVGIPVPGVFVNLAVAVIVNKITADLQRSGIDQGIGVIAVRVVGYIAARRRALLYHVSRVTVSVAVTVQIPIGGHSAGRRHQAKHY